MCFFDLIVFSCGDSEWGSSRIRSCSETADETCGLKLPNDISTAKGRCKICEKIAQKKRWMEEKLREIKFLKEAIAASTGNFRELDQILGRVELKIASLKEEVALLEKDIASLEATRAAKKRDFEDKKRDGFRAFQIQGTNSANLKSRDEIISGKSVNNGKLRESPPSARMMRRPPPPPPPPLRDFQPLAPKTNSSAKGLVGKEPLSAGTNPPVRSPQLDRSMPAQTLQQGRSSSKDLGIKNEPPIKPSNSNNTKQSHSQYLLEERLRTEAVFASNRDSFRRTSLGRRYSDTSITDFPSLTSSPPHRRRYDSSRQHDVRVSHFDQYKYPAADYASGREDLREYPDDSFFGRRSFREDREAYTARVSPPIYSIAPSTADWNFMEGSHNQENIPRPRQTDIRAPWAKSEITSQTSFPAPLNPRYSSDLKRSDSSENKFSDYSTKSSTTPTRSQRWQSQVQPTVGRAVKSNAKYEVVDSPFKKVASSGSGFKSNSNIEVPIGIFKASRPRQKHERPLCKQCADFPEGFRDAHELRRHIDQNHKTVVKKWICAEPDNVTPEQRPAFPLSECKVCSVQKKAYGAYYNAAAHLRRSHFNRKPPRRLNLMKEDTKSYGSAYNESAYIRRSHFNREPSSQSISTKDKYGTNFIGGDWPPMSELKLWMKEISVNVVDYQEQDNENMNEEDSTLQDDLTYDIDLEAADSYSNFVEDMTGPNLFSQVTFNSQDTISAGLDRTNSTSFDSSNTSDLFQTPGYLSAPPNQPYNSAIGLPEEYGQDINAPAIEFTTHPYGGGQNNMNSSEMPGSDVKPPQLPIDSDNLGRIFPGVASKSDLGKLPPPTKIDTVSSNPVDEDLVTNSRFVELFEAYNNLDSRSDIDEETIYDADNNNPHCNTLYVGNLPIDTSEDELKGMFSKQRGYKRLCFRTKQNGPMCFVQFEDDSLAAQALDELQGKLLHNSNGEGIRLTFSKNPLGVRSEEHLDTQHISQPLGDEDDLNADKTKNLDPSSDLCSVLGPATDSGYASMDLNQNLGGQCPEDDDNATICTDNQTLDIETEAKEKLIAAFISDVLRQIQEVTEGISSAGLQREYLIAILKDFSIRLGKNARPGPQANATTFVRHYRKRMAAALNSLLNQLNFDGEEDDEEGNTLTGEEGLTLEEKMSLWSAPREAHEGDQEDFLEDDEEDLEEFAISNFPDAWKYLTESEAYKWFLGQVKSAILLTGENSDAVQEIRQKILAKLPTGHPEVYYGPPNVFGRAAFTLRWALFSFLGEQYQSRHETQLLSIITITGSGVDAQAITCGEYMRQVWPTTGLETLQAIQEAVKLRVEGKDVDHLYSMVDGTKIQLAVGNSTVSAQVEGTYPAIVEVGQQLAWLGAALRSSPLPDVMAYCRPRIMSTSNANPEFDINYEITALDSAEGEESSNGSCWRPLFRNPVLVQGYPILARLHDEKGLEIPLNMMAGLGMASRITEFAGGLVVKGFSTLFCPTKLLKDSVLWHYLFNKDGGRISYLESDAHGLNRCLTTDVSIPLLQTSRHFLGWTSSADCYAGAKDVKYEDIQTAGANFASAGIAFEKASLMVGSYISGGVSFTRGMKDTPLYITRVDGPYELEIEAAQNMKVVLYDTFDRRAWLIDGASALLHLTRAQLGHRPYSRSTLFKLEDFNHADPEMNSGAAEKALLDERNRNLPIFEDVHVVTECRGGNHEVITTTTQWKYEKLVRKMYHILELARDYEERAWASPGVALRFTDRDKILGFSFMDLVKGQTELRPRAATLEASGQGWVDFTRGLRAITLFGKGFGEILRPTPATNKLCRAWRNVPKGKDYLVARTSMLEEICNDHGNCDSTPMELASGIFWDRPDMLYEACDCGHGSPSRRCDRVQILQKKPRLGSCRHPQPFGHPKGAVIFGRKRRFARLCSSNKVAGEDDEAGSEPEENTSFHDSGLGDSDLANSTSSNSGHAEMSESAESDSDHAELSTSTSASSDEARLATFGQGLHLPPRAAAEDVILAIKESDRLEKLSNQNPFSGDALVPKEVPTYRQRFLNRLINAVIGSS